jgi:GNAT superfamily N-acetyltransferase
VISIQQTPKNRYGETMGFYQQVGYGVKIHHDDTVLEARDGNKLGGVVRLAEVKGALVLRGMFVEEDSQRRGVGTMMLEAAGREIGSRECWCIPFDHLRPFYSQIGFQECAREAAPEFLQQRLDDYQKAGRSVIIMRREHGPERL